jgi:hypothetical protein
MPRWNRGVGNSAIFHISFERSAPFFSPYVPPLTLSFLLLVCAHPWFLRVGSCERFAHLFPPSSALTLSPPIFHFHFPVFSHLSPIPHLLNHFQIFLDRDGTVMVTFSLKLSLHSRLAAYYPQLLSLSRSLNKGCFTTLLQSTACALFFKIAGWHTQPLSLGASK